MHHLVGSSRSIGSTAVHEFGSFRLDAREERLWSGIEPVSLRPKTFAVLRYLVERPQQLVRSEELLDAVWGETHVSLGCVNTSIRELRRTLGDDAKSPRFIATVHRRGFRFVANVRTPNAKADAAPVEDRALFVGREAELERLSQVWAAAQTAVRRLVLIAGESGVGKTALVERFIAGLGSTRVAWGQALHVAGEKEPYLPLLDAWTRYANSEARVAELRETFHQWAPAWGAQLPGLVGGDPSLDRTASAFAPGRMVRELLAAVDVLTRHQPLVLVLEDLQWSDNQTIDALQALAHRAEPARLLVLATFRPVDAVALEHPIATLYRCRDRSSGVTPLGLEPLEFGAVRQYVAKRFEPALDADRWAPIMRELTSGNPLFMELLSSHLEAKGLVKRAGDHSELTVSEAELRAEAPHTLSDAIQTMLATLSSEACRLLETASVVGEAFRASQLVDPAGVDHAQSFCARLARASGLIVERAASRSDGSDEPRFAFRHAAFRKLLYHGIPVTRRRRLHGEVGRRLEALHAVELDVHATTRFEHFELAEDAPRAIEYALRAAEVAAQRFALGSSERRLRRALELLPRLPNEADRSARELEIRLALGSISERRPCGHADEISDNLCRCAEPGSSAPRR